MPTLTESQIKAANLLASNATQQEAAEAVGVSRVSIYRWMKMEEFHAEVERRRIKAQEQHQEAFDRVQDEAIEDFYQQLQAYRQAKINIYKLNLSTGTQLMQKIRDRLRDLPPEAISPKDMAALMNAASSLCDSGMAGWGDILAIDELMKRLQDRADAKN